MGAGGGGGNDFSDGSPVETTNLVLDRNLYWNGGTAIPPGDQVNPSVDDVRRVVADPMLNTNQAGIVLPRWNGAAFASGSASVREEFIRLVNLHGAIPAGSPARNQADPALSAAEDILGRPRSAPDLGAFEVAMAALSVQDLALVEGDAGSTDAVFTVQLSGASAATVTVDWATADGTAASGSDYTHSSGSLSFAPGTSSQTVAVPILGDGLPEDDETFAVSLSGAANATIADGQAVGTILDDEALLYFTVTPCRVVDTRQVAGPTGGPALVAGTTRTFPVRGVCGIPPAAKAVVVNVAVTGATASGNLRLFPADHPMPLASAINFRAGHTRVNNGIVRLGGAGASAVRCDMAAGQVHLVLDAFGYFE
jgi:hypothetical protein